MKGLSKYKLGSFALVRQKAYEKENSEFKPAVLCLEINLLGGVG